MSSGTLAAFDYGSYVSVVKLAVFAILFFAAWPIAAWVRRDAEALEADPPMWTGILMIGTAVGALLWLLLPVFAAGLVVYLLLVGGISLAYVFKRNSMVTDYEKVLTPSHIMGLFAGKSKDKVVEPDFHLFTANKNEVEPLEPRTPEYAGWRQTIALLKDMMYRRVSETVFSPSGEEYNCLYIIDGMEAPQQQRNREQMNTLTRFLKHLADLDISETRKPQNGKFAVRSNNKETIFQVITAGSRAGEQVTLRVEEAAQRRTLEELGLTDEQIEQFESLKDRKKGLFVISGPRGTGVTTTFYTRLCQYDAFMNNITTLERRPAAELNQITQNIYSLSDSGTTSYSQRTTALLRRDPDIFGLGDCDDEATMKELVKSARQKLIYVTVEGQSIVQALAKLIKWTGDKDSLIDVLIGISCQRLLRNLCDECKEAYEPNKELLKKFNIPSDKVQLLYRSSEFKYTKRGKPVICDKCQGMGFYGRTGLFETVMFDSALRKALKEASSIQEITTQLRRAKMLYLQEQAIRRVIEGTTAINEVIREFSPSKSESSQGQ